MRLLYGCATAATAAALAACGADEPGTTTVASRTAVLAPAVVPDAAPTPTPTPALKASATPAWSATVEPYFLGSLTYTLPDDTPEDKAQEIRDAMDAAVMHDNTVGAFTGTIPVIYDSGVETADATYQGTIRFGGTITARAALHEMAHWLGSGTVDAWNTVVVDGKFTGKKVTARIKELDGTDAVLNADSMHFWPYGLNQEEEWPDHQRNPQILSAQIVDLGLSTTDATAAVAGSRRFQNRASSLMLQGSSSGRAPIAATNAAGKAQIWKITYYNGFISLVNTQTGLALASKGNTNGAGIQMVAVASANNQRWEMIPSDSGYFLLRNKATGNCIDNFDVQTVNQQYNLWECAGSENQQFRFIK